MIYVIGIPLVLLLSVAYGGWMAKKKESLGTGKVYGFLLLAILTAIMVGIAALLG